MSNTPIDTIRQGAIRWIGILLCVFTLAEVNYPILSPHSQLAIFAMLGLVLCYLHFPAHPRLAGSKGLRVLDFGLAALTAWGTGRFDTLVAGITLPFGLPGETPEQVAQRMQEFNDRLINAGLTVFNDFFLVAMALSLIAIGVTAFMAWNSKKAPG